MNYAIMTKELEVNVYFTLSAVVAAESIHLAVENYCRVEGLGTPVMMSETDYKAGGFVLSVRKAKRHEAETFRVVRGPRNFVNQDVPMQQLPIAFRGLPDQVAFDVLIKGLRWQSDYKMLFGGYYVAKNGECYFPMTW